MSKSVILRLAILRFQFPYARAPNYRQNVLMKQPVSEPQRDAMADGVW
jgi:hypothetical protein